MNCPRCNSEKKIKNGIVRGLQRYKCKNCGNNYTVKQKSTSKDPGKRRLGLILYLEGLGFNSIGRLLGVSHVSVMKWIKKYGCQLEEIRNEKPVSVVNPDEIHNYIQSAKNVIEHGLYLIERENDILISLSETEEQKPE